MNDHETDRIRDLLEQAAPTHPDLDAGERTAAVVRRGQLARRRTQLLAVAAVAAVIAGAVALPRFVDDGDGASTDVVDQGPSAPPVPEPCPAEPIDVTAPAPVPALATDLVSVRSCAATWDGAADGEPDANPLPEEPLTGEYAAAFAEDLAALPAYRMPDACASMLLMPQPWALVVELPDADPVVIGSTVRDCGSVRVGGVDRGVKDVLAAFEANLERQVADA